MGTTIVTDPPMMPTVNFGPQFSHNTCSKIFKLTNNGRRSQQLYWMTEGFSNYKAKLKKERRNKEMDKTAQVNLFTIYGMKFCQIHLKIILKACRSSKPCPIRLSINDPETSYYIESILCF